MSGPPRFLLDTNALWFIAAAKPPGSYFVRKHGLFASPFKPLTSIVNIGEIQAMVATSKNRLGTKFLEVIGKIVNEVVVVPVDGEPIVEAYVEVHKACRRRNIGDNDKWIAATALATEAALLTTDSDFEHLLKDGVIRGEYVNPNKVPLLPPENESE